MALKYKIGTKVIYSGDNKEVSGKVGTIYRTSEKRTVERGAMQGNILSPKIIE